MSGRRGSNSPPIAWKAIALPNELLPLIKRTVPPSVKLHQAEWARMDSNHRTRKRTDLQSVAVGHLATCPYSEPLVGIEPTTYWLQISCSTNWATSAYHWNFIFSMYPCWLSWWKDNKELPQNFGKAKVREFANCKNFEMFFCVDNENKKTPACRGLEYFTRLVFVFSFLSVLTESRMLHRTTLQRIYWLF